MQNEGENVMCLSIPGNSCRTAAVWQVGEGAGRLTGDGTTVGSSLLWPPSSDTSAGGNQSWL